MSLICLFTTHLWFTRPKWTKIQLGVWEVHECERCGKLKWARPQS